MRDRKKIPALKWHCLRRVKTDRPFDRDRLREGVVSGAVMEVDLRALADGDFVCLHDATADRETTGKGPVSAFRSEDMRRLVMKDDEGQATEIPPLLFGELVGEMERAGPLTGGHVQIDFKDSISALSRTHRNRLHEGLSVCAERFVLTGGDALGLLALAEGLPGLRIGYDPCTDDTLSGFRTSGEFAAFVKTAIAAAPFAAYVYLDYPIVLAGLDAGVNIVSLFQASGKAVDAYTLNTDCEGLEDALFRLVGAGVDQITTDEPILLEAIIRQRG